MLLKITKCDVKSADWKVVDVETPTGEKTINVSVNRVNKEGRAFPNFDDIKVDYRLNATLWVSQAGKAYLFEPKPENAPKGKFNATGAITKAMEKKEESISKFQDKKEINIRNVTCYRMAHELALEIYKSDPTNLDTQKELILNLRKWYEANWDFDPQSIPPFPNK